MSNKLILWIIVLAAGAGILISADIFRGKGSGDISQETPAVPILSPTPSEQNRGPSISQPSSPNSGEIGAACQVGGEIVFLNKNLYENKNAKIAYQNVDDRIRQIYWKSDPADGALAIGPNLFENLPLPDGERNVGVALAKDTVAKNYVLTAAITYGVKRADGSIEEKIANCTGGISVDMSNI